MPNGHPSDPAPRAGTTGTTAQRSARHTPGPTRSGRRTLTREDWARAALRTMRESGLSAVAVEPLAERLGTTKGSFYWHFKDRDALIHAALEMWTAESEQLMAQAENIPDPAARGRWISEYAFTSPAGADITTTLLAHADHPVVGPFLERVTEARIAFGARINEQLGMNPQEARRHALIAWSTIVGIALIRRGAPQLLPQGQEREAYVRAVVDLLAPCAANTDRPLTPRPGPPPHP